MVVWLLCCQAENFVPSYRKKKKKEKHNIILNSIFRYSEGKQTLSAHAENIPLPNALRCVSEGRSWGPLHIKSQVSHLLMSRNKWLQQMREVQGNSKAGYLAVHQPLSHCQAFCQLGKEKKPKRILKRESPLQGWFLQLLQAVLHRNIYLLHPMYRVQVLHVTLCLWDGVLWWDTKGQIFSLQGNKNVLLQKTKSFPGLSPLQTMHSSHTTHSMFCCHSANIACTLYFLCNCINSI